ncbi:hypothetical protein Caci_5393 [Catenulispora acidiphila DSM 44928]|uniref:Uncharacterized protein n=1 Tax=Catenulispora acidiphila (strain DSM 44928 / JCM 14897 / NBRC 102108 / NRRL B-24433 / ID139908) TaxID=479433 RepID=C7Q9A6_CATAD|nr:hypothetical protein [Catenulispora acidiphila]ACU74252.1 hypothetical protein Caci_5393 [Catenulispora acidiphila DSM 44928]
MASVTPERQPITYCLEFGEDWYRIRLDEHAEADVNAFLDVLFDGIPADAAEQGRTLFNGQFAAQITAARSRRGIELLVPAPKPHAAALPGAAVLVAEVVIPAATVPDPIEVIAHVARNNAGARTGLIAGSVAVRIDHSFAGPDIEDGTDVSPSPQRVEYVVAVPNDVRWLSIDLSVQAVAGFTTHQAITEFDQAVGRLTWSASE